MNRQEKFKLLRYFADELEDFNISHIDDEAIREILERMEVEELGEQISNQPPCGSGITKQELEETDKEITELLENENFSKFKKTKPSRQN